MSKFVRTTDNYIYDAEKYNGDYYFDKKLSKIVKEAENISDLVDGYWWENSNYKDPIYNPTIYKALERLRAWLNSDKQLGVNTLKDITVYGSIYIKGQGWKHVSKLIYNSDKDDFEEVLL